ncbi:hypothetical protein BV20DRAFT_977706 [Pilatotrama ljubarskyi]|nr:hypothetical protein BV20DRAFT_977706 [Pilatotrama ljubarskyi]
MGTASVADAHRGVSTASRSDSEPSRSGTEPQCAIHAQPSQRPEAAADIVPVKKPFALSSGSQRRSNRLVHRGQDSDLALDVQPDVLEAEGLGAAAASSTGASTDTPRVLAAPVAAKGPAAVSTVVAQRSGSKKRAPKGAIVLAKAKYKPEVISEQMLFMGRMIAADPGVTHADYMDAFKKLTSEEHERDRSSNSRRNVHKNGSRNGTSRMAQAVQQSREGDLHKLCEDAGSDRAQGCRDVAPRSLSLKIASFSDRSRFRVKVFTGFEGSGSRETQAGPPLTAQARLGPGSA